MDQAITDLARTRGRKQAGITSVGLQVGVEAHRGLCTSIVRDEILPGSRSEALRNAFRTCRGDADEVELRYDERQITT